MHAYRHTYTHICTYIHTYIHTHTHIYTHTYTHIYTHSYIHTHARTRTHSHTHRAPKAVPVPRLQFQYRQHILHPTKHIWTRHFDDRWHRLMDNYRSDKNRDWPVAVVTICTAVSAFRTGNVNTKKTDSYYYYHYHHHHYMFCIFTFLTFSTKGTMSILPSADQEGIWVGGGRCITPLVLNLGTRAMWAVSSTPPRARFTAVHTGAPFWASEEESPMPLLEFEPQTAQPAVRSLQWLSYPAVISTQRNSRRSSVRPPCTVGSLRYGSVSMGRQ